MVDEIILDFFRQPKSANLNFFVMMILSQNSTHGYELIKKIEEKTLNQWKPSHGAIYKTLNELEKKGYLQAHETGERHQKRYVLTQKGKDFAEHISRDFKNFLKAYIQIIQEDDNIEIILSLIDFLWTDSDWNLLKDDKSGARRNLLLRLKSWLQSKLKVIDKHLVQIEQH